MAGRWTATSGSSRAGKERAAVTPSRSEPPGRRCGSPDPTAFRLTLLWRSALRLPLGLLLQRIDHGAKEILHELVLSGPYPLVVWSAPFLLGMWLGRRDLRSRVLAWRLVLVGGVVAIGAQAVSAVLLAALGRAGVAG